MTNSILAAGDSTKIQAIKGSVCMETLDSVAQTLSTIHLGTLVSHFTRAKAHCMLKNIGTCIINIMYILHRAAGHCGSEQSVVCQRLCFPRASAPC